ncbi:hypothetical protein H310_10850 [Aphanomyces invadans]|uniref:Gem-associated protein 2 n=1 Tax=Aphanomyces invadans TaxID=157072 RepID=A0A024TNS8_9STRA|nr:hypothetical protein H310_10850 [Aphanomyces invadans]ETV95795.1 hypothetical protein H310_10850 [Aphanomyces invadans]|eukprot:XP_008875546.1 hypothetical protein H310_10850 [Aphanomyces invadans]
MDASVLPVADVPAAVLREYQARAAAQCPPTDAQEYMWRVRMEAASIPDVTTASVTIASVQPNTLQALFLPSLPPYPAHLALSRAARMQVLAEFADLRQYLAHVEATLVARPIRLDNVPFPKMSEEAQWRAFFLRHPPTVKVLLQMDQVLTQRLLQTVAHWLDDSTAPSLSRLRAVWAYGLLARLEKPLVADMDACVRQIFRWCWDMRHKHHSATAVDNTHERDSLNVLICICDFFGQGDEMQGSTDTSSVDPAGPTTYAAPRLSDAILDGHHPPVAFH